MLDTAPQSQNSTRPGHPSAKWILHTGSRNQELTRSQPHTELGGGGQWGPGSKHRWWGDPGSEHRWWATGLRGRKEGLWEPDSGWAGPSEEQNCRRGSCLFPQVDRDPSASPAPQGWTQGVVSGAAPPAPVSQEAVG